MKTQQWTTGLLLIAAPLLFNGAFLMLASRFDYPAVLHHPAGEVLTRFAAGGMSLLGTWYVMLLAALMMIPLALITAKPFAERHEKAAIVFGVLAGLVQALGLARWVFVTPYLAKTYDSSDATIATQNAIEVIFTAFNHYLGVGIGEHLGYLFTGVWTLIMARGLWEANRRGFAIVGTVSGVGILLGLGEATGAVWAQIATVMGYLLWAAWLIALGGNTIYTAIRPARVSSTKFVSFAASLIALLLGTVSVANAQETQTARPESTLYVHAFRSPLIGLEYRRSDFGIYAGRYTTIISRNSEGDSEDTWFNKIGVTYYFGTPFVKQNRSRLESFVSVAYMRGTANSWRDKNAGFIDTGVRYNLGRGFEARIGTGVLFGEGHSPRVNPTPGISYSIPLR
ncbi:MAG: DUF4386 domain-containing protein [Fibrella sp.]|nr:DUF4386 domain-containing protein [Armatimonadota bacterium]